MSSANIEIGRRKFLATSLAGAVAIGLPRVAAAESVPASGNAAVRPFRISIPEAALAEIVDFRRELTR
ncbi:hypothetical protein BOSEA31B_15184 [Hyphomicrobiales bacterium]|nr:hypothetical protein BOSEA31B_15184 [Hyphomicrobiales bacterium]CAH1701675.1 hypothetical protein BOSEA1005_21374 [Hyphomicrobiales bacterium]CAI0345841.1 hypothetical protein BO1005MUT1_450069 [Hyphomicrobiales bacterium]